MYAKLKTHELAERLAYTSTGLNRFTGLPDEYAYTSLHTVLTDWLVSKGYEEDAAQLKADTVLRSVAKGILEE